MKFEGSRSAERRVIFWDRMGMVERMVGIEVVVSGCFSGKTWFMKVIVYIGEGSNLVVIWSRFILI